MKQTVKKALRTTTPQWTPDCLEPDALIELAEEGTLGHDSPTMVHVAACPYCRPAYLQMRADLLQAEQLRAASGPLPSLASAPVAVALPAEETSKPASPPSWWERLFRPRALVPAFGMAAALLVYLAVGPLRQAQEGYTTERERVARLETQLEEQRRAQAAELAQALASHSDSAVRDLTARLMAREQEIKQLEARQKQEQQRLQNQIAQLRQRAGDGQGTRGTGGSLVDRVRSYQVARVDPQELEQLRLSRSEVRSGSGDEIKLVELLSPVATLVAERRPWLRWKPIEGAARYVVTLAKDKGRATIEEKTLEKGVTAWQPENPLSLGTTFDWQVVAVDVSGKTLARSRARFLTQKAGVALPQMANALMELGRLYERAGLLDEAEQAYAVVPDTDAQYKMAQERLRALAARRSPAP